MQPRVLRHIATAQARAVVRLIAVAEVAAVARLRTEAALAVRRTPSRRDRVAVIALRHRVAETRVADSFNDKNADL